MNAVLSFHRNIFKNICFHHKIFQNIVKMWLNAALKKEEESWLNGGIPELIDQYYFSPLAIDVIQVSRHLYCREQDFHSSETGRGVQQV